MKLRRAFSRFASAAPGFNRLTGDVTPFRLLQGAALRSMAVTVHHPRPTPRGGAIVHSETNVPVTAAGIVSASKRGWAVPVTLRGSFDTLNGPAGDFLAERIAVMAEPPRMLKLLGR